MFTVSTKHWRKSFYFCGESLNLSHFLISEAFEVTLANGLLTSVSVAFSIKSMSF